MEVKTKFIELKAAGMPMYKIANELGVHRATIMRWNRELAPYILIARQDVIDEVLFENGCMRVSRIEKISKMLTVYYEMFVNSEKDSELDSGILIERITKLTKLLMMESNAKSAEDNLQNDEDLLYGLSEENMETDETVLVTDKEKFNRYEPDEETLNLPDEEIDKYVEDIKKRKEENIGFINSHPHTVQNISEKAPELQEVFNNTLRRKSNEGNYKTQKCDKNVTIKKADVTCFKKKKRRG
jgi:transposase-like protein